MISKWEKCKRFLRRQDSASVSGGVGRGPVVDILQRRILGVVGPEEAQYQQDSQDEDDEYQEKCAAVILTDFSRRRPVLCLLTGLTVWWWRWSPVVLESVVSNTFSLLSHPVIILRLLSLHLPLPLLLLLRFSNFTQLKV